MTVHSRVLDDGETVQVDIMTIIKAGAERCQLEEDNLRQELRHCYHDFEELCDIHVRLTRKRLHELTKDQVEDEVLELAQGFTKERQRRIRRKLGELMGGK